MDKETEEMIREEIERRRKKEREQEIVRWIYISILLFFTLLIFAAMILP